MRTNKAKMLIDALEPVAQANDTELVDVEIVGTGSSPVIRIYIDAPGGVGLDELAAANQWIDAVVEEIDPFPGAYMLEVSSPGIDRPLRTEEHFVRFAGEQVALQTIEPINGRGKWTGVLCGMEGEDVIIEVEGERIAIPFTSIKKANIKGQVDFTKGKD